MADFGIARALGNEQRLTDTGVAMGTPAYMSPEQASADRQLDARTDVYALGCVLYEMLAGEPPFTGHSAQVILARARTEQPRPIHPLRAAVPEALDRVIARAMAATPADRFASAAEFARALGPGASGDARPASPFLRRRSLIATLAFGFLLGLGVLFTWRRSQLPSEGTAPKLLAVLPFENLGSPEDEYFADGVTDEVRGKLTALTGLQVIARASSMPFKKTTKLPQQIAHELGAQYLLMGTVRWEKHPGGSSSVHVSPELVLVRTGAAPTTRWQQSFDAQLTNVFQVQADIASRVARALDVALDAAAQHLLAEPPTANLAAYDAFLRGEAITQGFAVTDPASMRRSLSYYEQAVALDSTFAQAWAKLSLVHTTLYFNSGPTPAGADAALRSAQRAIALAPNRPEGHAALGSYYRLVLGDNLQALAEHMQAHRLAPGNATFLSALAPDEWVLGQWRDALEHLEQAERLDPRSVLTLRRLAAYLLQLRRYPEALEACERGLAIAPTNGDLIEHKAMLFLAQGDLGGARTLFETVPKEIEPTRFVALVATYYDLMWVLDDAQQALLLQLTPGAFDGDRGTWGIVLAQTYALRGDKPRARAYADSARIAFAQQLHGAPTDGQRHVLLGLALAYLGRKAGAIREGERGVALMPLKNATTGPYLQHQLVRIYTLVNEPDKALDRLEPLLKVPYYLSPGWLRIDPNFDSLRSNPRFQRLAQVSHR